jgi:hypothetical protein
VIAADLNAENQRLREQLAVVRKQADEALALHAEVETQLIAMTAARDEACELGEEFIPEDYEPAYSRIAELRAVGKETPWQSTSSP